MRIIKSKTADELKLTGFLSEPETPTRKIVIHIHGMAGSPYDNEWYSDFHELYPKNWLFLCPKPSQGCLNVSSHIFYIF
jgi:hypothetical protein